MYTQINITSYRIGPWSGRLPLRLISVAVMEATQQGENKYNVATDHQAKQTKQNTISKMRACVCVWVVYARENSSLLRMYVYQSSNLSICLSVRVSVCLSVFLSVFLFVCQSVCMSVYLSVYMSVCYFCFCLNLYLSICLNVFLFVRTCPSIERSV